MDPVAVHEEYRNFGQARGAAGVVSLQEWDARYFDSFIIFFV